jgi:hypothetical protein
VFGLGPKEMGQLIETADAFLAELRRLNDNLEALRRDGIRTRPADEAPQG